MTRDERGRAPPCGARRLPCPVAVDRLQSPPRPVLPPFFVNACIYVTVDTRSVWGGRGEERRGCSHGATCFARASCAPSRRRSPHRPPQPHFFFANPLCPPLCKTTNTTHSSALFEHVNLSLVGVRERHDAKNRRPGSNKTLTQAFTRCVGCCPQNKKHTKTTHLIKPPSPSLPRPPPWPRARCACGHPAACALARRRRRQ